MLQARLFIGFLLSALPLLAQIPGATYTAVATEPTVGQTPVGESRPLALSANGRYLLFSSRAPNVLVGQFDPNGDDDLFLRDLVVGDTQLVSRAFASPLRCAAGDSPSSSFLTADGGKVLFTSNASDILAPGVDTNLSFVEGEDVFEYDRVTRTNTLLSSRWDDPSRPAEFGARLGAATPDRRFLLIESSSTDLIAGFDPVLVTQQVFLFDRTSGSRRLITHAAGQPQTGANGFSFAIGMALSSDGRFLLFASSGSNLVPGYSSNGRLQLFRYDTVTQTAQLVSRSAANPATAADGEVFLGTRISPDGRWVLFLSSGTNLVAGQVDSNSRHDLFLFDAETGVNTLVNHLPGSPVTTSSTGGTGLGSLSDDGRLIVYSSAAPDLVAGAIDANGKSDAFLFDRTSGQNRLLSHVPGHPLHAAHGLTLAHFAGDLRHIVLETEARDLGVTDVNGGRDLFLYDATSSTLRLVSRSETSPLTTGNFGTLGPGVLAPILDRFLFSSAATDHVSGVDDRNGAGDLFSFQLSTGTVTALPETLAAPVVPVTPKLGTYSAIPSANGRFITFTRSLNGFFQLWLLDRQNGQTALVSHAFNQPAIPSNGNAYPSFVTDDGRFVVFESEATNLIPNFVPGGDPFVDYLYDRATGRAELLAASAANPNQPANSFSFAVHLSPDGRYTYMLSQATDLMTGFVPSGPNDLHLFLRDRVNGTTILVDHAPGLPLTAANGSLGEQRFSPDGRFVVFSSLATNLVPGVSDANGNSSDAFFYDRLSGNVELLSSVAGSPNTTANAFTAAAGVSADGRFALLGSAASNLATGVADSPGTNDVYVRDRLLSITELISHQGGAPLVAVGSSIADSLSEDGRFVLFESGSPLLVPTTPPVSDNVYLYDRASRSTTRVSSSAYDPLDGGLLPARAEALSATGRYVLFSSQHSRFVSGFADRNGNELDLFLYDHGTGRTLVVSHPPHAPDLRSGDRGVLNTHPPITISRNGNVVTFETFASNFLVNDLNFTNDVVVVSTEIFVDGFESGSASRWSVVVP